jgi:geranylgeranyl reductase family protein
VTGTQGIGEEAEVAVVGAGPAGCSVAATLAELGHDVLLVDKSQFPREKPCGDGLLHAAVAATKRMGLEDLIESSIEIESIRMVGDHRRQIAIDLRSPNRPNARCIPRKDFDAALLSAAQGRGARFLQARVESFEPGAQTQRLQAIAKDRPLEVKAGLVIAADGATSRIRRVTRTRAEAPGAYAIRQYFKTELPLDMVFQVDVPIEVDGRTVPGYGWVFPLGEHTANIGIGVYREAHQPVPSLRALLDVYVSTLRSRAARRFGDLEPIGEPLGSPMGIRRQVEVSDSPGLVLVGDAAGTTHPLTGEGIAFAMRGGETLGAAVHARLKRGRRPHSSGAVDPEAWRAFPQLGIDTSLVIRGTMLVLNRKAGSVESAGGGSISEPYLAAVWRLAPESAYDTGIGGSPAWAALDRCDPVLSAGLEETNDLLLDRLSDPMPFVAEIILDSVRAHLGPMYAAVVLATAANGGALPKAAYEAAVSVETGGVLPKLLAMLVDRAGSKQLKLNNAMAVLTGDFAATRGLTAAAKLGPLAVAALSRTCQGGCEGGMRDAGSRFSVDRDAESWLEAARETEGAGMVLATEFGALAAGRDISAAAPLRRFGLELGVALRLAEEIADLTVGTVLNPEEAGASLGRGIYPLPVLYAIEAEPSLRRLLAQHTAERQGREEIVRIVQECGALERAIAECEERCEVASSVAADWSGNGAEALAGLAALPAEYVASRVSVGALEAC